MGHDTFVSIRHGRSSVDHLIAKLSYGLADRCCKIEHIAGSEDTESVFTLAISLNGPFAFRLMDKCVKTTATRSPCEAFRTFWGPKSELRKFKDGSLAEVVVWDPSFEHENVDKKVLQRQSGILDLNSKYMIVPRIIMYILEKQCSIDPIDVSFDGFWPYNFLSVQPSHSTLESSYSSLKTSIMDIESPIKINLIVLLDSLPAFSSIPLPSPSELVASTKGFTKQIKGLRGVCPVINSVIVLESSSNWPSDNKAAACLVTAFLLHISKALRLKSLNSSNGSSDYFWTSVASDLPLDHTSIQDKDSRLYFWPSYLDVWYNGSIFRFWLDSREILKVPDEGTFTKKLIPWSNSLVNLNDTSRFVGTDLPSEVYCIWDFRQVQSHRRLISCLSGIFSHMWQDSLSLISCWLDAHFVHLPYEQIELLFLFCGDLGPDVASSNITATPLFSFIKFLEGLCNPDLEDLVLSGFPFLDILLFSPMKISDVLPLHSLKRLASIARSTLTLIQDQSIDVLSKYSAFKHDQKTFDFTFEVSVEAVMNKVRRKALSILSECERSSISRLDLLAHIYLPGFNPLINFLDELSRIYEASGEFSLGRETPGSDTFIVGFVAKFGVNASLLQEEIKNTIAVGLLAAA